jgi:hypothetical protein
MMTMTNTKSHGNQQRSLRDNLRNVQRLSRKGVGPSGSKRGATLKEVGDIVWPLSKDKEGQEKSYLVHNKEDRGICELQHNVHGNAATGPGSAREVYRRREHD